MLENSALHFKTSSKIELSLFQEFLNRANVNFYSIHTPFYYKIFLIYVKKKEARSIFLHYILAIRFTAQSSDANAETAEICAVLGEKCT